MGAPERSARRADAPNRLHRSYVVALTRRARRQWRPHALARVLKVRKCHDGAWNTLAKNPFPFPLAPQTKFCTEQYIFPILYRTSFLCIVRN